MAKIKFNKEAYLQMIEQKLAGTTRYEEMQGRKKNLASIAQRLRQTISKTTELSGTK